VYLDEYAHAQHDREIYTAAIPVITKGGRLRMGSSPLGASGVFWEVYEQKLKTYPGYTRKKTPWWQVQAFCLNVAEAAKLAPAMTTAQRVERYGNERIQAIFANMLEEDFQQEYECEFVDEATAWIPWEFILRNQASFENGKMAWWHAKSVDDALGLIDAIKLAIARGEIEQTLYGGIDVGRKKDLTEFTALGKATTDQLPFRLAISLDRVEYADQEACFRAVVESLPFVQVLIDRNGIGAHLAENLEKTGKCQGVDFTNASKQLWAVETKIQMERANVPIPNERDLAYQIHSIKKAVTAAKNVVFDTERNEKHHADKFWSLALAVYAAVSGQGSALQHGPNPLAGYRG